MNVSRRQFLLSAAAVPVTAALPFGELAPVEFHGVTFERDGIYAVAFAVNGRSGEIYRVMLDNEEVSLAPLTFSLFCRPTVIVEFDWETPVYSRALVRAKQGQLLHIDASTPIEVDFIVARL